MLKETIKVVYQQCLVTRKGITDICWLPKKFAVLGKCLRIDALGDGWKVEMVYPHVRTSQEVIERHKDDAKWFKKDHMDKIVLGDS